MRRHPTIAAARIAIAALAVALWPTPLLPQQSGLSLAVIAHSVSTRIEARTVLRRQGWTQTDDLRRADGILVVCRSSLTYPLNSSYPSIRDLDEDVNSQLNISGPLYHAYLYRINADLSVSEVKHVHYKAND
jgi:hypothetical protein